MYGDMSSSEEKKREDEILKEKQRNEALEKLNYHFYRRAVMESRLTGETPEAVSTKFSK